MRTSPEPPPPSGAALPALRTLPAAPRSPGRRSQGEAALPCPGSALCGWAERRWGRRPALPPHGAGGSGGAAGALGAARAFRGARLGSPCPAARALPSSSGTELRRGAPPPPAVFVPLPCLGSLRWSRAARGFLCASRWGLGECASGLICVSYVLLLLEWLLSTYRRHQGSVNVCSSVQKNDVISIPVLWLHSVRAYHLVTFLPSPNEVPMLLQESVC